MKKVSIYILSLFVIILTACEEDYKDWADPQTNPQEEAVDITFSAANASVTEFDLAEITAENVEIMQRSSLNVEEAASVSYDMQISNQEGFAERLSFTPVLTNNIFSIKTAELEEAVVKFYGRRPEARQLFVRLDATITQENKPTLVARSNAVTIQVTPESPDIETAYYLVGGASGWNGSDVTTLLKFEHSGNDVYEDPFFVLQLNVPDDGGWKIVPQSAVTAVENGDANDIWGAALGTDNDGDTSLTGAFGAGNSGAMKIGQKGWARITLDMLNYTYSVEILGEMSLELYVPGGYQGWKPATAPTIYTKGMDMKYDGYINIAGDGWDDGFKFISGPDWPNPENNDYKDYGTDPEKEAGNLMGKKNVKVDEAGYYRITVDLSETNYTYAATKTDWFIVGDATVGGWTEAESTPLEYNSERNTWSVTTNLIGSKHFKFFANQAWTINLGGDLNDLSYGGSNIPVAEDGEFTITLDLSDPKQYKATVVKN